MYIQNLIIFKLKSLYHIFNELSLDLNFEIIFLDNEKFLNEKIKSFENYVIISNIKYPNISNQFILLNTPVNIFKLVEKINIQFLKLQFNNQSELKIKNYTIDLNSREMFINHTKLKLTEKEIKTIAYLYKLNKPVSVNELQKNVWSYQYHTETHTVETHIYRLRKKILKTFSDNEFIVSKINGYQIR